MSQGDLRVYLQAAKAVDPVITPESRTLLRRAYRRLRQASARISGAAAITVRQLESLIRLSEAIARVHLDSKVKPSHIETAFDLMKNTLGSGVGGQITLDEDEEEEAERREAEAGPEDYPMDVDGNEAEDIRRAKTEEKKQRQTVQISYQEYQEIVEILMKKMCEVADDASNPEQESMSFAELTDWYLQAVEEKLNDEEDVENAESLVKKVIHRLYTKDKVIILAEQNENEMQKRFKKHPEYVPTTFHKDKDDGRRR